MTLATGPATRTPPRDPEKPRLVGTRGSPLALIQTRDFLDRIRRAAATRHHPPHGHPPVFQEHVIRTTGDATQAAGTRLADIGGKGLFAKEIHEALADGRIDCAVHSLKDLESELPPGIVLGCTLPREDPRDALILGPACRTPNGDDSAANPGDPYACLPPGAVIGTASVRRQAQLLRARPDLTTAVLRGNVQTRLDKVASGACTASLLAYAGLRRMGLADRAGVILDPETMLPAVCQGIIGVTVRADDTDLRALLAAIEDSDARVAATAERALLAALDGSCRTPIGGYARLLPGGDLHLSGLVARADGGFLLTRTLRGPAADAARIGTELGASLRADSPRDIFG
jgi:hydroxymethylbilane synthase